MKFLAYANYLKHKRVVHRLTTTPTSGAPSDAPMGCTTPAAAHAGAVPAGIVFGAWTQTPTAGTPAVVSGAASGALASPSGGCNAAGGELPSHTDSQALTPTVPPMPVAFPIPVSTTTTAVASRIAAVYRSKGDLGRTRLYVPSNKRDRPSDFLTKQHKDMRLFALSAGGCGLSLKEKAEYYETTVSIERAALRMVAEAAARRKKRKKGKNGKGKPPTVNVKVGPLESAFPTAASFVRSLEGEKWRCLAEQEWRETDIPVRGKVYKFYSRDIMKVATDALTTALKVCLRGERKYDKSGDVIRTNSLDSDVYLEEQADVDRLHAGKKFRGEDLPPFTLAIQLFSDAALVSWNGSKLVALRPPRAPSFCAFLTSDCSHSRFGCPLRLVF